MRLWPIARAACSSGAVVDGWARLKRAHRSVRVVTRGVLPLGPAPAREMHAGPWMHHEGLGNAPRRVVRRRYILPPRLSVPCIELVYVRRLAYDRQADDERHGRCKAVHRLGDDARMHSPLCRMWHEQHDRRPWLCLASVSYVHVLDVGFKVRVADRPRHTVRLLQQIAYVRLISSHDLAHDARTRVEAWRMRWPPGNLPIHTNVAPCLSIHSTWFLPRHHRE